MTELPRKKSPRAPSMPLNEALDRTMKVYDQERLHPAPVEVVAAGMGYKSANNGAALSAIASTRYYGLLERQKEGYLSVARKVEDFRFSPSETQRRELLIEFLRAPPLYAELLDKYATGLPSDGTLKFDLIQRGFIPAGAENALNCFKLSVNFVGYFEAMAAQAAQLEDEDADIEPPVDQSPMSPMKAAPQSMSPTPLALATDDDNLDKIPVRLPGGRKAWLSIPSPFYEADKVRLKAQIDLLLADDEL